MKNFSITVIIVLVLFASCKESQTKTSPENINWKNRAVNIPLSDSLEAGTTYLSVYSQIYSLTESRTHDLTVTVSMRNMNAHDTIYIQKAEYYDTAGQLIHNYINEPIFLAPMETVEIVIEEIDRSGGTGGNFLFDWNIEPSLNAPLFEAVMISTSGQQGLSFTTTGVVIK